ncbi:MAG: CPBP family intramembrane glutamic endopeptidase [Eubacteriales bacterium]
MSKIYGIVNSLALIVIALFSQIITLLGSALVFVLFFGEFGQGVESTINFFEQHKYIFMLINWIIALIVFWLLGYNIKVPPIKKNNRRSLISASILLGIGLNIFTNSILSFIDLEKINSEHFNSVNKVLSDGHFVLGLFAIGIIGPIFEELLFRKFIFKNLRNYPITFTIIIQAALFGIYHFNIIQFIYATFIGIFLGVIIYWTDELITVIIIHCIINTLSYFMFRFQIELFNTQASMTTIIGAGFVFLGLYEFYLVRKHL